MKNAEKIKRYLLILNYLTENKKPTKEQIHNHIHSKDLIISDRTLSRDISDLRNEFDIRIDVDYKDNTYSINYEDSGNIDEVLRLFKISNSAQVMIETINEGKNTLKYLSLDSSENLTGIELLEPLITALKTNQVITFNYFSFQTEETKPVTLYPYLLKEYKNRWFLYGENEKYGDFRTYGIERITELKLTENHFDRKPDFDPKKDFENIIGIAKRSIDDDYPDVQKIILSMTEEQGRYFKSLPLHSNYKPLIDNENEFKVSLNLLPNYEFLQILYMYCDKVTVLEPQWLRDHLKKIFKASSDKY